MAACYLEESAALQLRDQIDPNVSKRALAYFAAVARDMPLEAGSSFR